MTTSAHRLRRIAWLALVLASLGVVLAGCGVVDPQASRQVNAGAQPGGKILFAQGGDIYLWDGDVKQVTKVGNASSPSWAPDGNRFVFVESAGNAYSDLYVGQVGSNQYQKLTNNKPSAQQGSEDFVNNAVWALDPNWSPRDDTIVYASDQGTPFNYVWMIRGLGNQPEQVRASTANQDDTEDPRIGPDGKIVFTQRVTDRDTGKRSTALFMVDPATGAPPVKLAGGEDGSYDPAWSPDGKWIAYVERNGANNDLWVVPAAGGNPTKLTDGKSIASPVWSPDGNAIAFFEPDGDSFHVSYVTISAGANGALTASKPSKLFSAGAIDAPSGMSWAR